MKAEDLEEGYLSTLFDVIENPEEHTTWLREVVGLEDGFERTHDAEADAKDLATTMLSHIIHEDLSDEETDEDDLVAKVNVLEERYGAFGEMLHPESLEEIDDVQDYLFSGENPWWIEGLAEAILKANASRFPSTEHLAALDGLMRAYSQRPAT